MSCVGAPPTFRLLDGLVGWDAAHFEQLTGQWDPAGIRLVRTMPGGGLPPGAVWPYLPPARLAYDCAACTWLLATAWPPASRILQLGPCDPCDTRWASTPFDTSAFDDIVAIAVHTELFAAADRTRGEVRVWTRGGSLVGTASIADPTYLTFASGRELLVVSGERGIVRLDPAGIAIGALSIDLAPGAAIVALGVGADGTVWALMREADGRLVLRRRPCRGAWRDATLAELSEAFPNNGLTVVADDGFCLRRPPQDRSATPCCFSWYGRPGEVSLPPAPSTVFATQGQLLTEAIDSGQPRCRWHRVRLDADVPVGTQIEVAVATAELVDGVAAQGQADPEWAGFAAGVPHPLDWQTVSGTHDFLINQPPGRYLYVRLRLISDGAATPVVRSVRLDFPRATSVDALPAVYREEPRAEDFTERFVSLFDAALEDLDQAVERFPALLDVTDTPDDVLPWLARFLGATFDPAWDTARRRAILRELPALYPLRGTPAGLSRAVRLVFDVDPAIEEVTGTEIFGAVASAERRSPLDARLGAVRLFGPSRARFRLGSSALSRTPLRSYGDPSLDALTSGAFRFRVLLPATVGDDAATLMRVRQLIDSQKPAHTVASIRIGSRVAVVGGDLRVGVDTQLGAPPPPVLGAAGNVRLRRGAILHSRRGRGGVCGPALQGVGA